MANSSRRSAIIAWVALTICTLSLSSCATKPQPDELDRRACLVAELGGEDAAALRALGHVAQPGDVVVTRACFEDQIDTLLNEIRILSQ